ncbi:acetate uptake transporter [Gryllotalpicola ginsengisoli]|uniref:acetate uptake transporter n=1 Tax=Gryllotalpicola ginsengisoli TaxID=444608 RepID=UPI0003B78F75|nr:acetate uptake transporter family protein [Gryllotalpicola ginsengisoli]
MTDTTHTTQPTAPVPVAADPAALGLAGFALTTFVLSAINAGWFNADLTPTVLGLALFYGGVAQLAAGLWEFANRNTFGAAAFSSYGAFWLSFWYLVTFVKLGDDAAKGTGLFLLAWGIFTLYMTVASWKTNLVTALVFSFLTLTFFALAFADLAGSAGLGKVGGYLGLITAVLAWYGSFASVTNFTFKKTLIPIWPL